MFAAHRKRGPPKSSRISLFRLRTCAKVTTSPGTFTAHENNAMKLDLGKASRRICGHSHTEGNPVFPTPPSLCSQTCFLTRSALSLLSRTTCRRSLGRFRCGYLLQPASHKNRILSLASFTPLHSRRCGALVRAFSKSDIFDPYRQSLCLLDEPADI